ncbi:MAG: flagellar assembly protein FliW [Ignavibacteriota bacterium]
MAKCLTKSHGEIEYSEDVVMHFPEGLFGFESETRFIPIEVPALHPLLFLQSVGRQALCFITIPILVIDPHYRLTLSPADLELAGLPPSRQPVIGEDVLCLAILTLHKDAPATANLIAPLVMNLRTRQALQAIVCEGEYSHQHLFPASSPEAVCS